MTQPSTEIIESRLRQDALAIAAKAAEVSIIETPEQEARAVEFCSQAKARIDLLETARTRLVKPLNDHVKSINAEFKAVVNPIDEAITTVKGGMSKYRQSQSIKEAEERKAVLEQEARLAASQGDVEGMKQIAQAHAQAEEAAPSIIRTQSGKASFRTAYKFEIIDATQLPRDFLMPDEAKIRDFVKSTEGRATIPGVRTWTEDVPIIGR